MRIARPAARVRSSSLARAILACLLSLTFLTVTLSVGAGPSGPACSMPCCSGKAMHAAGSCMGNACHAHLRLKKRSAVEHLCVAQVSLSGLLKVSNKAPQRAQESSKVFTTRSNSASGASAATAQSGAGMEAVALKTSCRADCSCASSLAQTRRPHHLATLSLAAKRPADLRSTPGSQALPILESAFPDMVRPRGPPLTPDS